MADLAADLTAGQITDLRDNWIRDRYTASPFVALSEFNKSRKAEFFSDAQLNAAYDRIVDEYHEELEAVQYEKENERLEIGDSEATAEAEGDALREQAFLRLIRRWCRAQMMEDPGFRASVTIGNKTQDSLFDEWKRQNTLDLLWVRSRAGWENSVEVERS